MRRLLPVILSFLLTAPSLVLAQPSALDGMQRRWSLLEKHRGRLEQLLASQVRRISRLKAQSRGVRRDYQLTSALRENQKLASRLTQLQEQIRQLSRKLISAYDRAIARTATKAERNRLEDRRDRLAAQLAPARSTRIVTREKDNPLDSAEDLEEKADLLKDSEEKVRKQLRLIQGQIKRLKRRAKLKRHSRAVDDSPFVEDSPRRLAQAKGSKKSSSQERDDGPLGLHADGKTNTPSDPSPGTAGGGNPPPPSPPSGSFDNDSAYTNGAKQSGEAATPPGGSSWTATSPSRSSGALSVTIRGVMDPSILRELQKANRSGSVKQRIAALKKVQKRLKQVAGKLNSRVKQLRKRAKKIR